MLQTFRYFEYRDTDKYWHVSAEWDQVNLIVGKNASGKSRTVVSIYSFAGLISGRKHVDESNFDVTLRLDNRRYDYSVGISNRAVVREKLNINGKVYIDRSGDQGDIRFPTLGKALKFQVATDSLAVSAKRDAVQHPFLEPLHAWAAGLRFFKFGDKMGQDVAPAFKDRNSISPAQAMEGTSAIPAFIAGEAQFGEAFKATVKRWMRQLGYRITDVGAEEVNSIPGLELAGHTQPFVLFVRERGIRHKIYQYSMSAGMYRALSLLIQLCFARKAANTTCILVDDIGEGLDFTRSTTLVKLLVKEAKAGKAQLIMATNDRFIMNSVPIDYWRGIRRGTKGPQIVSAKTEPESFLRFAELGLSNFDFFAADFRAP